MYNTLQPPASNGSPPGGASGDSWNKSKALCGGGRAGEGTLVVGAPHPPVGPPAGGPSSTPPAAAAAAAAPADPLSATSSLEAARPAA